MRISGYPVMSVTLSMTQTHMIQKDWGLRPLIMALSAQPKWSEVSLT